MNGKNLKYFALGAAIVAVGLGAMAVTIPNTFSAGQVISAAQVNANFAALKTAVDALEAPDSVNTARIASNAVNATKISDEPGVNTNQAGSISTLTPLTDTGASLVSVTLDAPTAGFAIVTAEVSLFATHTNGTLQNAIFAVSRTAGDTAGSGNAARVVRIPASHPTTGTNEIVHPVSITATYSVAAGANTFHLNGRDFFGGSPSGGMSVLLPRITAIFVPTRYGSGAAPLSLPSASSLESSNVMTGR